MVKKLKIIISVVVGIVVVIGYVLFDKEAFFLPNSDHSIEIASYEQYLKQNVQSARDCNATLHEEEQWINSLSHPQEAEVMNQSLSQRNAGWLKYSQSEYATTKLRCNPLISKYTETADKYVGLLQESQGASLYERVFRKKTVPKADLNGLIGFGYSYGIAPDFGKSSFKLPE